MPHVSASLAVLTTAVLGGLALAASAPAADSGPPPPGSVRIANAAALGKCLQQTTLVLDPAGTRLDVLHHDGEAGYEVRVPDEGGAARKMCALNFTLSAPGDWKYRVGVVTERAVADVVAPARGKVVTSISSGKDIVYRRVQQFGAAQPPPVLPNPVEKWSGCGGTGQMAYTSRISVEGPAGAGGRISLDSREVDIATSIELLWAPCERRGTSRPVGPRR